MFGSTVLDVGIGLVLTYLFLSLVVTAANELCATFTRARATDLERGIRNLMDGKSDVPERWWDTVLRHLFDGKSDHPESGLEMVLRHLNALLTWKKAPPRPAPKKWSKDFFAHPLIYALSQDDAKPCYVPSQTFATVLMHLVQRSSGADPSPAMAAAIKAASDFAISKKNNAEEPNTSAKDAEDALKTAIDALQAAKKEAADAVTNCLTPSLRRGNLSSRPTPSDHRSSRQCPAPGSTSQSQPHAV